MGLLNFLSNSDSRKAVKKLDKLAKKVEDLEPKYAVMTDEELKSQTAVFKERLANGETLDDLLFDAFAALREASWRVLKMKHFHVQIIGGICLHQGRIAEMRTGEGKTLVSTLPAYLNALTGKGVHIVTVNDYLAKRDAEWMGKVHKFMGLTVGVVVPGMDDDEKKKAYESDILYATNNELGFDYLRDNLKTSIPAMVQRELNYCIIDEVDSILIDEARTPLIISGRGGESSKLYEQVDRFVRTLHGGFDDDKKEAENKAPLKKKKNQQLTEEEEEVNRKLEAIRKDMETWDYVIDRQDKSVIITELGAAKAERFFNIKNLGDIENAELNHHIQQALKAHELFARDESYIVTQDGEIMIVDEFTGRLMVGRRYSDGLHQAIEAKEHVKVREENKTHATVTFQNYFRLYKKLSGMTGTAKTEEAEFRTIYSLDVVVIPTNKPIQRVDEPDAIFSTVESKKKAIVQEVSARHEKGQPVLIGTVTVDKSEEISRLLMRNGIKHYILNAKNHEREAEIVAQAGRYGAVTIATNMAGRGTDILLGGNSDSNDGDLAGKNKGDKDAWFLKLDGQTGESAPPSGGSLGGGTSFVKNDPIRLHVGPYSWNCFQLDDADMRTTAVFGKDAVLSVMSHSAAQDVISLCDQAISYVSAQRSRYGSYQNALEHLYAANAITEENVSASESLLADADLADEMVEFSRSKILEQANLSVMAQANMTNQSVLKLL